MFPYNVLTAKHLLPPPRTMCNCITRTNKTHPDPGMGIVGKGVWFQNQRHRICSPKGEAFFLSHFSQITSQEVPFETPALGLWSVWRVTTFNLSHQSLQVLMSFPKGMLIVCYTHTSLLHSCTLYRFRNPQNLCLWKEWGRSHNEFLQHTELVQAYSKEGRKTSPCRAPGTQVPVCLSHRSFKWVQVTNDMWGCSAFFLSY